MWENEALGDIINLRKKSVLKILLFMMVCCKKNNVKKITLNITNTETPTLF